MKSTLELHRFNGLESYDISTAECNAYECEDETEVVFTASSSKAIATLPDTQELKALPHIEIGFRLSVAPDEAFAEGAVYADLPAYSTSGEYMTNLYYFAHTEVEKVAVRIEAVHKDMVTAEIEGTTTDVSYYDGSKPATKVRIRAVFQRRAELRKSF